MNDAKVRLYCFSPAWGLPTIGPFVLKLIGWFKMAGIDYELVHEDNPRKGPKGKIPWIEDGSTRMGDSGLIIEYMREKKRGNDPDAGATPAEQARDLAIRRMLEEHTHQVVEYELFVIDPGLRTMRGFFKAMPAPVQAIVPHAIRWRIQRELHARGMGRHSGDEIERLGKADVDAIASLLGDAPFLGGDAPRTVDASAFGLLGMLAFSPLQTPLASYIRQHPRVMPYLERLKARWLD